MTPVDFRVPNSRRVVVDHNNNNNNQQLIIPRSPPPLKVNKDSRAIKKPFSPSSSSSPPSSSSSSCKQTNNNNNQQQQHLRPVIIYTHSPKVIQTKPEDFMALVQKLTGFSKDDHAKEKKIKDHQHDGDDESFNEMDEDNNKRDTVNESTGIVDENEENESSVIREEHGGNLGVGVGEIGGRQVNSTPCFLPPPPIFDPIANNPFYSNKIVPNNQGFYDCNSYNNNDALLFGSAAQNLRCSMIPSSSSLEALNEFREL